jgi:hypothetical protein
MQMSKKTQADLIKLVKQHFKLTKLTEVSVDATTQAINITAEAVELTARGHIPMKLGRVEGDFYCISCELTSLENAPHTVTGSFWCVNNNLTTLKGGPQHVEGAWYGCGINPLTNFEGAPADFTGSFSYLNQGSKKQYHLENVDGLPVHCRAVELSYQKDLPMLKLINHEPHVFTETYDGVHPIEGILMKYRNQGKAGALKAAMEMIRAGYKDNARW